MAINGNNILVYLGGTAIAGMRSHDIEANCEMIEVSSPTTGAWRKYIAGRKEWNIIVNYLVLASSDVRDLLTIGTTYTLKVKGRNDSDGYGVTGTAILKTCKITATRGNLVQGSFQFVGISALN